MSGSNCDVQVIKPRFNSCGSCGNQVDKLVEVPLEVFKEEVADAQPCVNPNCREERRRRIYCVREEGFVGDRLCCKCEEGNICRRCFHRPCEERLLIWM